MKNLITLFLLLFLAAGLNAQEKSVVRISNPSPEDYKTFIHRIMTLQRIALEFFLTLSLTKFNTIVW